MKNRSTTPKKHPPGMGAFIVVWIGQAISLFGSSLTWFAFIIWAWQTTGQATTLSLVGAFSLGPTMLLSPLAGALVDRWDRKRVMMFSDLATGLSTLAVLLLYATDSLQIWHLYIAAAFAGAFQAFQFPAYSAAMTMMLPKEQYTRAESMVWTAQSAASVLAPPLAAILLGLIGIVGVMIIDVVTFVAAVGALFLVHIPQPSTTEAGRKGQGSLWHESIYGFRYIFERPSLLNLLLLFFGFNLVEALVLGVRDPMVLASSGGNENLLGKVQSASALGVIVGGILLSLWGGSQRRVHGVLIGCVLASLLGTVPLGLGRGPLVWISASFLSNFFTPLINGSDQAIWLAKVAPDVQGRVFATRQMIEGLPVPVAMLLGGLLADYVFEPAMQPGGALAGLFGGLVGTGAGAGMSLMFVLAGLMGALVGLGGYALPRVRNIEDILPDHDSEAALSIEAHA